MMGERSKDTVIESNLAAYERLLWAFRHRRDLGAVRLFRCTGTMGGLRCQLRRNHKGLHLHSDLANFTSTSWATNTKQMRESGIAPWIADVIDEGWPDYDLDDSRDDGQLD